MSGRAAGGQALASRPPRFSLFPECARAFSAAGARLVLCGRNAEALEELSRELAASPAAKVSTGGRCAPSSAGLTCALRPAGSWPGAEPGSGQGPPWAPRPFARLVPGHVLVVAEAGEAFTLFIVGTYA